MAEDIGQGSPVTELYTGDGHVSVVPESVDADEAVLNGLGYRQEFKRKFNVWSIFSLSFSSLGLLPSMAATLTFSLGYAGSGGFVWGWIIAAVMTQFLAASIAELCSSLPTAGGLYYASAVLAPDGWGPLASWITGWSNLLGQLTAPASVDYGMSSLKLVVTNSACSTMILAAAAINNPDYTPQNWHIFLLSCLILFLNAIVGSLHTIVLARVNQIGTAINLIALLIFFIVVPVASINTPKFNDPSEVWGTLTNGTEWPTGFAVIMSFLGVIWTMSGYDAPFHVSEECSNANTAAPTAIVMTSGLGGILGWFLVLVIAYTITDIYSVLNSVVGQPMGSFLLQVLGKKTGLGIFSLVILCCIFEGQGCMIVSSRVIYAYSRDGVLPGSRIWSKIHPWTRTPVYAVWIDFVIAVLLNLLVFGGPVSIGAIFSMGATAQYVAFSIPIALRVLFVRKRFRNGPWNLGKFSRICGAVGIGWVVLIVPILSFPSVKGSDLRLAFMNWTCLVYGGAMLLALAWYAGDARRWFKGPRINVQHRMLQADVPGITKDALEKDLEVSEVWAKGSSSD